MYCKHCGAKLDDNAKFCSSCGGKVDAPAVSEEKVEATPVVTEAPAQTYEPVAESYEPAPNDSFFDQDNNTETYTPAYATTEEAPYLSPEEEEKKNSLAKKALTFGILSIAFALYGVCLAFLGIIFGAKAKSYAAEYKRLYGTMMGRVGVGRGLGIGGLIAGIFFTVFWALYVGIIILAVIGSQM